MFKPGEIAKVRSSGQVVTILSDNPNEPSHKWPIATSGGVFEEAELFPANPAVLLTAEGCDRSSKTFDLKIKKDLLADLLEEKGKGLLSYDILGDIEDALPKIPIDFNGHWKNGTLLDKDFNPLEGLFLGRNSMNRVSAEDFLRAVKTKTPLDHWISINSSLRMTLRKCPTCIEDSFSIETNGQVVRIAGDPCKFPNGLPLTEWELNVPSGKLVVANDLREIFPLPEDEDFDVNTNMGCRQTALAYAENGLSHAFVGNSCPGVYKCTDGTYKIANPPSDDEWDGEKYVKLDPKPSFDGEELASICTDLWWYSICDHTEFKKRCKHFKVKAKDLDIEVINVKPGVYRFSHDEEARGYEGSGECVYTRFEWIREPDEIKDYLAHYEEVEVNAHAYVQAQVSRWPTLYGKATYSLSGKDEVTPWSDMTSEEQHHSWQRVADQVFCTIGGGIEWHEKGFPRAKVNSSIPNVEPPSFRAQYNWYPFSKPYGGLWEPKTLEPSFAKLAFRVLESVISFGTNVRDSEHSREVHYVRERMLVAVQRYRELVKQYPDQADPEYVSWLSQDGRAEDWVENFPLGPEFTDKHRNHAAKQRWIPEDAYAIAFDARKLKDGNFSWHPKNGGSWARKEDAQRYAILEHGDNGQSDEHNCFWSCHATNTSIPLYSIARVVKVGEVSHMGETLVEVAFDYGTPWMLDKEKRKALPETKEKAGIKVLSQKEYEKLLPNAIKFFEESESSVNKK